MTHRGQIYVGVDVTLLVAIKRAWRCKEASLGKECSFLSILELTFERLISLFVSSLSDKKESK